MKIDKWDENGLGQEPNNLAAIRSLIAYRALRYGKHLDLIITDQRSFAGEDPSDAEEVGKIYDPSFRGYFSEEAMIALDAGKSHNDGKPPAELRFRDVSIPNPSKDKKPRTILGVEQKAWFKEKLRSSKATWKIWGNSYGTLDNRVDLQNLPAGMVKNPWPADTYGMAGSYDFGAAYAERKEIYDLVREANITGFAIVSGDRHAFWAGYAAAHLPPRAFERAQPFVPEIADPALRMIRGRRAAHGAVDAWVAVAGGDRDPLIAEDLAHPLEARRRYLEIGEMLHLFSEPG